MRALRVRVAVAAAATAVLGPLALLAAAADSLPPTRCADRSAVTRSGDWEAVRGPSFTERPGGRGQAVTAFAVHPARPQTRFVTNGTSVERSDDGGCTWREVYALPDVPSDEDTLAVPTAQVVELVAPADPRGHDRLLLVVRDGNGGPRVLASADGGRAAPFRDRSEGLPAAGVPRDLMVAATNPEFLFLAVETPVDDGSGTAPGPVPTLPPLPGVPPLPGSGPAPSSSPGALYASVDGGSTWEVRIDAADLGASAQGIDLLAGHPAAPNRVWAVSDGVLRSSTDGGRTFRGAGPTPEEQRARSWRVTAVVPLTLPAEPGAPAPTVVVAFSATSAQSGGPIVLVSRDGGATYDESRAPGVVDAAAAFLPGSGTVVASTRPTSGAAGGVHVLRTAADAISTESVGPPGIFQALSVSADLSDTPTFHARTSAALLRYVGPAAAVPEDLPPVVGGVVADTLAPLGAATLTPGQDVVDLEVGEMRTVPHVLTPPRRLRPLDLYVVVDTSISMADDLPRVEADLLAMVSRLRARGVDLSVGLGEFKGGESSVAYRRVTGVGPDEGALREGLQDLVADGYGLEAQLIAMEQALDGAGEGADDLLPARCKVTPTNPDRFVMQERRTAPPVAAGQQADFRRGAVPVVLMVTDTNFLRPAGTRLKPDCSVDVDTVARRYAAAGVHAVGLGVDDVDNPQRAADLLAFARITGALQPPGAPCAPAIAGSTGSPAVCRAAVDLVPTLEALAARQAERVPLDVTATGPAGLLRPGAVGTVDLRSPVPVPLPVTYSCVDREAGTYTGAVDVLLRGEGIARLAAQVTCRARPEVAPPPVPLAGVLAVVPLVPPAAPPPPPAPGTQVQTQPQPQTQVQSQVQAMLQEKEQAAAALAMAVQQAAREEGIELQAMSRREDPVPVPVWLGALTAVTAVAGAVAIHRQQRATAVVLVAADDRSVTRR